jgi:uncharacterized protein YkwD
MWPALVGLLGLCLIPTAGAQAAPLAPGAGTSVQRAAYATTSAADFERRLFARTNARRAAHRCRPLRRDAALARAAHRHSALMLMRASLSHRVAGEDDLAVRVPAAGYRHWRVLAENLAWGQRTPRRLFRDWVASPSHRANLDDCRLRDVGIAVILDHGRPWVTADFGRHA